MDSTATIRFLLQADTQQFTKGLDDAKRKEESFTKSVSAGLGTAVTAVAAAAAAAVGIAVAAISRAVKDADDSAKEADKLGIATDKLIALRFAAEEAGASQETLQRALRDSQRILAEGGKEIQGWTKQLGLNIDELRRQTPDQLFKTYADAIAGMNDRGAQFSATAALMGGKSQELVGLIVQGSGAMTEAEEITRKYGAALSDIEVEQLRQVDDAFDRAGLAAKGAGNILAVAFAPLIEAVVLDLVEAAVQSDSFKAGVNAAAETGYVAFKVLGGAIDVLQASFYGTLSGLTELRIALKKLTGDTEGASRLEAASRRWGDAALSNLAELKTIDELRGEFQKLSEDSERRATESAKRREELRRAGLSSGSEIPQAVAVEKEVREKAAKAPKIDFNLGLQDIPDPTDDALYQQQLALEAIKLDSHQSFSDRLLDITGARIDTEIQLEQFKAQQAQGIGNSLAGAAFGVAKTLFGNNKKFAIAEAIIGTYAGAAKALTSVPFPFNLAAAALVVANGLARVKQIKSTNPGSSGGGGGSVGGSLGSPAALDFGGGRDSPLTGATAGKAVQVIVSGNNIAGPDSLRWIAEGISDLVNGSDYVLINGQSRQAAELKS